ncbi:MAG: hypothetical protein QOC81_3247 [Thermoanaerobaculia bacterium]|jgi:hypothetical protein|nr:hypothetical protein [Thermoanaerobaculia bacterium]
MMMNRATLVLILIAIAMPLVADDAPKPDYSVEAMFRFSHEFVEHPSAILGFNLGNLGAIDVYKYGVRGRLTYLPFLAPLPGTRLADVATVPNAFALTNTPIARSMPFMPEEASLSPGAKRELKRVLKLIAKSESDVSD